MANISGEKYVLKKKSDKKTPQNNKKQNKWVQIIMAHLLALMSIFF